MKVECYDFRIVHHSQSIVLLQPLTKEGRHWLTDHVKDRVYFGPSLCVEPRFIIDLVKGIVGDGLSIAPLRPGRKTRSYD
jgi:hypothetical protein